MKYDMIVVIFFLTIHFFVKLKFHVLITQHKDTIVNHCVQLFSHRLPVTLLFEFINTRRNAMDYAISTTIPFISRIAIYFLSFYQEQNKTNKQNKQINGKLNFGSEHNDK